MPTLKITTTNFFCKDAVSEFTIGLILNTCRRISESVSAAKNGEWAEWKLLWMCGKGLKGSNLGIFGLGRIGHLIFLFNI